MKIKFVKDYVNEVPHQTRFMGIDLGTKTIGVAISDSAQKIATPVSTIKRVKFSKDILQLHKIIKEFEIGGYILGWPVNRDGSMGARCDSTQSFADMMCQHPEVFGENPFITFQDETLSTHTVDDMLDKSVNMSRTNRKQIIDKLAAQVILQEALDIIKALRV